jgi:hypothetical protein
MAATGHDSSAASIRVSFGLEADLYEPIVGDAEMMRQLMHHRMAHGFREFILGCTLGLEGALENRHLIRQDRSIPESSLRERDPLVQTEQYLVIRELHALSLVERRVVRDYHRDIVQHHEDVLR